MRRPAQGFTVLEFAILAAAVVFVTTLTVSKYRDISSRAKSHACRGALNGIRSGIELYYADHMAADGYASYPTVEQITSRGVVIQGAVPPNPYQAAGNAPDSIVLGTTRGETVGARGGWVYNRETGELWANTTGHGEESF